jgi:GNAT superfamily N-acetyltransferase
MRLIRYKPEFQEPMLVLHRSAIEGFTLGMSQQQDEADLLAIEEVYLRSRGEFLLGFLGERLVAMGGFKRLSDGLAELRRMRIARDLQGLGYGTHLLRELERRAFQSGVRTLCLDTARRRPLTLEFYRKHGYYETSQSFYGAVETVQFRKVLDERVGEAAANQSASPNSGPAMRIGNSGAKEGPPSVS